jgi:hypothetical protein
MKTKKPHEVSGALRPQHSTKLKSPAYGRDIHGPNPSVGNAPYAARPSSPKAPHSKKDKA